MYVRRAGRRFRGEYRDSSGRRHSRTFDLERDASAWAKDQEAKVRIGRHRDPKSSRQTVAEYAELAWWPARVVEATTEYTNRLQLDNWVLPEWGRWPLDGITPSLVQSWVLRLVKKENLSASSARACHALLQSILEAARRDGLLPDNPARGLKLPQPASHREVFLTREEVDAVCEQMAPFDRAVAITLAYTGIRWGELAGLHMRSLHLLRKRLDVMTVCVEIRGQRTMKPYPKSRKGRTVPLASIVVDTLAAHLAAYPAERDELVFRDPNGRPLSRHWNQGRFKPAVLAALGRDDVRTHDLRHTCASWLVQSGVPLTEVQRILGHASITMSQRYSHLLPDDFDRVLVALDGERRLSR